MSCLVENHKDRFSSDKALIPLKLNPSEELSVEIFYRKFLALNLVKTI